MPAGIYLHIPFCKSRCSYCDFATDVYKNAGTVERYVAALCSEVAAFESQKFRTASVRGRLEPGNVRRPGPVSDSPAPPTTPSAKRCHPSSGRRGAGGSDIDTIYFGGGTPSLINPGQLECILNAVTAKFNIHPDSEITMEMNPATVSLECLQDYRSLGVNRASFGVQTFDDHSLKLLARGHDAKDAHDTYDMLREAGFENVSFDLIIGLPHQTPGEWERNLDEALAMQPEHLSLYLMEIHAGTPLAEQIRSRRQPQPDEELAAEMYELMLDKVAAAGYGQYEISNFSRPGFESRHNSKYWLLDPVFGFGVSAHSFDGAQRYANERDTAKFVNLIESGGSAEVMREDIDLASEFVFLGLRMEEGINLREFSERFGFDLISKYRSEIDRLSDAGLVGITDDRLRLTRMGKLFSNEVFAVFV